MISGFETLSPVTWTKNYISYHDLAHAPKAKVRKTFFYHIWCSLDNLFCFLFFFLFILEKRESMQGRGAEKERCRGMLHNQHKAWHGARSHDAEIMTWAEIKSHMLSKLCHPGTFFSISFYLKMWSWPTKLSLFPLKGLDLQFETQL